MPTEKNMLAVMPRLNKNDIARLLEIVERHTNKPNLTQQALSFMSKKDVMELLNEKKITDLALKVGGWGFLAQTYWDVFVPVLGIVIFIASALGLAYLIVFLTAYVSIFCGLLGLPFIAGVIAVVATLRSLA